MFSGQKLKEIREAQGMSIWEFHAPLILIGKMVRQSQIKRILQYWPNFLAWLRPIFCLNTR